MPSNFHTILAAFLLLLAGCGAQPDLSKLGEPAKSLPANPTPTSILVVGGTSGIGLETVKLALARGHTVAAMARRPERMATSHANLKMLKGDVSNTEDVALAMKNHQTVVFAVGIKPTRDPVSVFSTGTQNILSAMNDDAAARLIMVTGIGAGDSRDHGGFFYDKLLQPLLLKSIYEDKDRSEALIYNSNLSWTVVRPGFLIDTPSEARYRIIKDMQGVTSGDIPRADVAHYILWAIETGSDTSETVFLSN